MSEERIGLGDTILSATMKLSEGNPGALRVCMDLLQHSGAIDPDSAMGGLGSLLCLDTEGIYGPQIWMLYKDVCGENLVNMVAVLRAMQLGIVRRVDVKLALNHSTNMDVAEVLDRVQLRLPAFGKGLPLPTEPTVQGKVVGDGE